MAKSTGSKVADRVADFIGKSLAGLANRKDKLQRELAEVDGQIGAVRQKVLEALPEASAAAGAAAGKAARAAKRARRYSEATRAKMAAAARRRWAKAKKAGKNSLG